MKLLRLARVTITMRPPSFRPPALLRAILFGGLLATTSLLRAGEGGFAATLSTNQQVAAGLTELSPVERVTLDLLVAGELAATRRADAPELAGNFDGRRTTAERQAAGLDRLTAAQLAKFNEFVAAALAAHPKPKERPRLKDSEVLAAARKNQIHGSVTVAYGWGGGRDLWAESLWLDYYDPESRVGIGIGLTNFNSSGFYGYAPDYNGGGRYYAAAPVSFDVSSRGGGHGGFDFGEGQSFGGGGAHSFGHSGRQGR